MPNIDKDLFSNGETRLSNFTAFKHKSWLTFFFGNAIFNYINIKNNEDGQDTIVIYVERTSLNAGFVVQRQN